MDPEYGTIIPEPPTEWDHVKAVNRTVTGNKQKFDDQVEAQQQQVMGYMAANQPSKTLLQLFNEAGIEAVAEHVRKKTAASLDAGYRKMEERVESLRAALVNAEHEIKTVADKVRVDVWKEFQATLEITAQDVVAARKERDAVKTEVQNVEASRKNWKELCKNLEQDRDNWKRLCRDAERNLSTLKKLLRETFGLR